MLVKQPNQLTSDPIFLTVPERAAPAQSSHHVSDLTHNFTLLAVGSFAAAMICAAGAFLTPDPVAVAMTSAVLPLAGVFGLGLTGSLIGGHIDREHARTQERQGPEPAP